MKYEDLKSEIKLDLDLDPWGVSTTWLFNVCFTLAFRNPDWIPAHWQYSCGAFGHEQVAEDYYFLHGVSTDDLIKFGNLLDRYGRMLHAADKSY